VLSSFDWAVEVHSVESCIRLALPEIPATAARPEQHDMSIVQSGALASPLVVVPPSPVLVVPPSWETEPASITGMHADEHTPVAQLMSG
jgi:hypothetical protein